MEKAFKNKKGHSAELPDLPVWPLMTVFIILIILGAYLFISTSLVYINGYEVSGYSARQKIRGISIIINEDTVTNMSLDLTLTNKKDKLRYYDEWYKIEKYRYGTWTHIDRIKNSETDIDKIKNYEDNLLLDSEDLNMSIDWKDVYGKLEPGIYRILKKIKLKNLENYVYIYNTFTITWIELWKFIIKALFKYN